MNSIFSQFWSKGLDLDTFISAMEVNQTAMQRRVAEIRLTNEQIAELSQCHTPRYVAVMSEAWCSDSLMNLPILAHVARALPRCEIRIYPRSQFPGLRSHWEERGYTHIPLCVFMDQHYQEIGIWMERPAAMKPYMEQWSNNHPEVAAIRTDGSLTSEEKRERLAPITAQLLFEMESWYSQALQQETVNEMITLLCR
jgi:hypothetical protein